ncbi:MAG: prolipoprotein diacylglyceryl transferase [Pirellulaceae bacterium]
MQQTFFLIPHQLGPLPMFGFGWALIVWIAACALLLAYLAWKQGFNGDTLSYLPVMLVFAAALVYVAPMMEIADDGRTLGLPIRGYGVMMLIGVVSAVGLAAYRAQRMGIQSELIFSMAFVMFLAGIVGARLFFIIEYRDQYLREPMQIFNVTQGGLVVYGSVLGGLPAGVIFLMRRGYSFRKVLAVGDIIAPSMLIGLAFGRIGCLMNGCCFGGVCEQDWAPQMTFPRRAAYALQDSPPYAHQRELGQLHGLRLASDAEGRAIVAHVYDDASEEVRASLTTGVVIEAIQLTPRDAVRLADRVPLMIGSRIQVEKADGEVVEVPVLESPSEEGGQVGFALRPIRRGWIVSNLTLGGPADMTGKLTSGDEVRGVTLPPLARIADGFQPPLKAADVAEVLLHSAGPSFTVVTDYGSRVNVALDKLPDYSRPVHPTQIYSAINGFLLCFFLWVLYPFRRHDGDVFAVMLVVYPIARFLLELIRNDEPAQFGTALTIAQLVSVAIFLTGAAMLIYLARQPQGSVLPESEATSA